MTPRPFATCPCRGESGRIGPQHPPTARPRIGLKAMRPGPGSFLTHSGHHLVLTSVDNTGGLGQRIPLANDLSRVGDEVLKNELGCPDGNRVGPQLVKKNI